MATWVEPFRLLRGSIVLAICALGLTFWLGSTALGRFNEIDRRFVQEASEARARGQKMADLRMQKRLLMEFRDDYQSLRSDGLVGPFRTALHLDHFEQTVRLIGSDVGAYALSGQAAAVVPGLAKPERHEVIVHRMGFDLTPRHEETFLQALDRIRRSAGDLASIEWCVMSLDKSQAPSQSALALGAGAAEASFSGRVKGRCELSWYSFLPISAAESRHPVVARSDVPSAASAATGLSEFYPRLGRLLLTSAQRRLRDRETTWSGDTHGQPDRFDGFMHRGDGRTTVWLNGQPLTLNEQRSPAGNRIGRDETSGLSGNTEREQARALRARVRGFDADDGVLLLRQPDGTLRWSRAGSETGPGGGMQANIAGAER